MAAAYLQSAEELQETQREWLKGSLWQFATSGLGSDEEKQQARALRAAMIHADKQARKSVTETAERS